MRIHLVSLSHPKYEVLSNSWVLTLFRKYLKTSRFDLFMKYFLPVAQVIDQKRLMTTKKLETLLANTTKMDEEGQGHHLLKTSHFEKLSSMEKK